MDFWKNLKDELDFLGISIKELAEKAGLQQQSVYNGIARQTLPSLESAYKISSALNVSIEYLLTGKEKKHELSNEQIKWLNLYNTLSEHEKKLAYAVISAITSCYENEISPDGENYIITT